MSSESPWFIADQAITEKKDDAFAHDDVAEQLVAIISSIQAPATIGLVGGFGTGKSSITNLLAKRLDSHSRYQVVTLSAEKHTGVARQRALVFSFAQALHEDAGVDRKAISHLLVRVEHDEVREGPELDSLPFKRWLRENVKENRGRLLRSAAWASGIACAIYGVVVGILALTNWLGWTDVNAFTWMLAPALFLLVSASGVLGLGALLPEWVKAGLTPDLVRRSRPRIEAADEFERLFGALADLCPRQLIVVVDDIDRLSPNEVLEALTSVRTFQSIPNKDVLFILTCDERVIREAVADARPGISDVDNDAFKAADEYLHKLFAVRQPLPPHLREDMRTYADRLLARTHHAGVSALGSDSSRVLDILIHDRVESPRHVIRLLNAFFTEYRLAKVREGNGGLQPGEVTSRPTLLARLTVLRVDFYEFFVTMTTEFALLDAVDALLLGAELDSEQDAIVRAAFGVDGDQSATRAAVPSELADFLRRTVRHVDRDRPLTAFIYLGQTAAGRILGSERAEQIRRSLENGNAVELQARFAEAGEIADAAVDHAIETVKRARPGLPLENAVGAAAESLPGAPEARRAELATELAVVIEREPEATPPPDRLANVIRGSSESHQEALLRRLSEFPEGESAEDRKQRAKVQLELVGEDLSRDMLKVSLATYFTTLHEEADSSSIPDWLAAAAVVPLDARNQILGAEFFAALATLLVGTPSGASDGWRNDLADLFAVSPTSRTDAVLTALLTALRASGLDARRAALAVLARLDVDPSPVPKLLQALADVITDDETQAGPEDISVAVRLIGQWSDAHAESLDAADPAGVAVLGALATAVATHPTESAVAFTGAAAAFAAPAAETIDALVAVLDQHRHVGDELGTAIRDALLSATESLSADDTDRVLQGLLRTVTVTEPPEAAEAQFALETVGHVVQRDDARARLKPEMARWIELLNQPTSDPTAYLTPVHALATVVRSGLMEIEQQRTVLTRLIAIQGGGAPGAQPATVGISLIPWITELRVEATSALAGHFDSLEPPQQERVVASLSQWPPGTAAEVDDGLQARIVAWLINPDRTDAQQSLSIPLSGGLDAPRRAVLVARLLPTVGGLASRLTDLDAEALHAALVESVKCETFDAVADAATHAESAKAAFASFVAASLDAASAPWNSSAVSSAVDKTGDDEAADLVSTAVEQLDEGEEAAMRGAVILAALHRRPTSARPDEEEVVRKVVGLLDSVPPDLASRLGGAVSWVPLRRFEGKLKELRGIRDDQRAREAAEAFQQAHRAG